jgi:uncharacterized protein YbjT (DUF2867 family)
MIMKHTALVIGATGLVGSHLLKQLLSDPEYTELKVFGRRPTGIKDPKLTEYEVDFDDVDSWREKLKGEVLFSALGTTIKKAGSKDKQYKVDYTYQFEVAKAASEQEVKSYVLVSSIGANARSGVFYTRIKGELDEAIQKLDFQSIYILRPSGLMGEREEQRAGEGVMIRITAALSGFLPFLRKYRPIPAAAVANAMIRLAANQKTETRIIENPEIFRLVEE